MKLSGKLLSELQKRLKIGNRRGVHLNAIPANSKYKFDLFRLSYIDKNIPDNFINALLTELPLKFKISWKNNVPDLNSLYEDDQIQLVRITKAFENLINQTDAIESEKGINTFGFGFPILARRDKADNKLTVSPILIWSLRIRRTKEFNTWEILRNEEDPIYINEVLINHLQNDSNVEIEQIPNEMLDDGLISKSELIGICSRLIRTVNSTCPNDLEEIFTNKLSKISTIGDKAHYEQLPLNSTNSFIDFSGLFSIFEVQKQNIINDYNNLLELEGLNINLEDLEGHSFQAISSVDTDPSQQSILHSLEATRNILIQGPPGTGKSQTLTAVLINALENNKKTIVVCEKRTALEVLHNALIEKNLNYHCVLIRDIVKDRKTVVESVRERTDTYSKKYYKHNSSKELLDNIISRVNNLIDNINNKHKKLDEKILGNKSWSDIVGNLLFELKNNNDDTNLNIDKNLFSYNTHELNTLLDTFNKGQYLYSDFKPIESTTFLNSLKLIGENPFLIEQNINDDFNHYSAQLEQIIQLLEINKSEYFSIRNSQLVSQIENIDKSIVSLKLKFSEFDTIILNIKESFFNFRLSEFEEQLIAFNNISKCIHDKHNDFNDLLVSCNNIYTESRHNEFNHQFNNVTQLVNTIDNIISTNHNNPILSDEIITQRFGFRFFSFFSQKRKQLIIDQKELILNFKLLEELLKISKDFESLEFGLDLKSKINNFKVFKEYIIKIQGEFKIKTQREFESLKFPIALDITSSSSHFSKLLIENQNSTEHGEFRDSMNTILNLFIGFISNIIANFQLLNNTLSDSKDFNFRVSFNGSINENINNVKDYNSKIKDLQNSINNEIELEFNSFNLSSILSLPYKTTDIPNFLAEINNPVNSSEFLDKLNILQSKFQNYLSELDNSIYFLYTILAESSDINIVHSYDKCRNEIMVDLTQIESKLALIKTNFENIIENEFDHLNVVKSNTNIIEIHSLPLLKEKINSLIVKLNNDSWVPKDFSFTEFSKFISDVQTLIIRKNDYFNSDIDLFSVEFKWFKYYNGLSDSNKIIVNELKGKNNWRKSFLIHYLNSLLINSANLNLPTNDEEHKELDNALFDIEKEQLNYIKTFWFRKQEESTARFEQENINLSVGNLYLKKQGTKNNRLSLRQIVQYDADLFTDFFPIILTSPDVASNLFKGMNSYFDIVMFDEASQLRLEDNLPAILKGKQIIIAGDEHQMPPSNYFSKVFDGSADDDDDVEEEVEINNKIKIDKDDVLLSCESLLEFGLELDFQKKYLDFHYRSRHPFLIDFSNYAFYNQRLKPLPNNFDYVPIKYVQVNGTFHEHINDAEAEMVLSIIDKNINKLPNGEYPSVGIATFNIAQRNLIKSKIEDRKRFEKYKSFNEKIQELGLDDPKSNKGFIKNLENIQGDERDVIILSTTYGTSKDGKFAQRFGPINHSKGYKLLNVIITRAKYKVYCCTSIPERVFLSYKEYLTTEGNNKRAVFYAYLAYCKSVSDSNNELRLSVLTSLAENTSKSAGFSAFKSGDLESPFEEEVYQSLADNLGNDKLIPQMQFAGFRIDIVYDPKIAGVPKIAIECDGAKYHSSREAYLYDRHRQKILENHGFVFHRIWSTNWWRNANRETNKLIEFIKKTESTPIHNYKDYSDTSSAFTDNLVSLGDYVSDSAFFSRDTDVTTIKSLKKSDSNQSKFRTDEVKLNSKVHVKYVNNGKDMDILIVSSENNKTSKTDNVQKLYYKSPLALSLMGQRVGDIVKIGNLDNFVEILNITN